MRCQWIGDHTSMTLVCWSRHDILQSMYYQSLPRQSRQFFSLIAPCLLFSNYHRSLFSHKQGHPGLWRINRPRWVTRTHTQGLWLCAILLRPGLRDVSENGREPCSIFPPGHPTLNLPFVSFASFLCLCLRFKSQYKGMNSVKTIFFFSAIFIFSCYWIH